VRANGAGAKEIVHSHEFSLCLVYFRPNVAELMARGVIFRPASAAAALSRSALRVRCAEKEKRRRV
jgi:hypothetical protein